MSAFLKLRREVAEDWRGFSDSQRAEGVAFLEELGGGFGDVVDVALGVDASWDRQAHELHGGGWAVVAAEHHRADLAGADAAGAVEAADYGLAGEVLRRDVGAEALGIDVDGVAAR